MLAFSAQFAGVWLNTIPVPSLGLKFDNESLKISGLVQDLTCLTDASACGDAVEDSSTHGLDCRRAIDKHARHSAVNDVIHRALCAAGIPSHLEP